MSITEGSYFSTHYYLGHRKFETGEPELFLFGETNDINFLNRKPISVSEGGRGRERESQTRDYKTTHLYIYSFRISSLAKVNLSGAYGATSMYTEIQ